MNTLEINKHFKGYSCYAGTFACDELPSNQLSKKPFALIMNTDPVDKPGQHWVAIFVDKHNNAEYFDSYGFPPLNVSVYKFFENQNVASFIHNTIQLQGVTATTCGAYCITFLKLRCQNISFNEIILLDFNDETIKNVI